MYAYEVAYDSIQKFFQSNNVECVYMDKDINKRRGPLTIFDNTTVIIKCRMK